MKRYYVIRENENNVEVIIIRNKSDNTFSFVNLTKQHICPCHFNSVEDAIKDLDRLKLEGEIKDYIEIL